MLAARTNTPTRPRVWHVHALGAGNAHQDVGRAHRHPRAHNKLEAQNLPLSPYTACSVTDVLPRPKPNTTEREFLGYFKAHNSDNTVLVLTKSCSAACVAKKGAECEHFSTGIPLGVQKSAFVQGNPASGYQPGGVGHRCKWSGPEGTPRPWHYSWITYTCECWWEKSCDKVVRDKMRTVASQPFYRYDPSNRPKVVIKPGEAPQYPFACLPAPASQRSSPHLLGAGPHLRHACVDTRNPAAPSHLKPCDLADTQRCGGTLWRGCQVRVTFCGRKGLTRALREALPSQKPIASPRHRQQVRTWAGKKKRLV